MSYESRFALAMDATFRDRVTACAVDHAVANIAAVDVSSQALASAIVTAAENALGLIKLVAGNTAFLAVTDQSKITDAQIHDALAAVWLVYAKALYPPEKPKVLPLPAEVE